MRTLRVIFLLPALLCAQQSGTIAVDKQEWRDQPVRHFYVHGTLNGDTAFQVLLPERQSWQGRLLHYLQGGMGGSENAGSALGETAYALANGAAYVESSQGHRGGEIWRPEDTMEEIGYQANYAVVQYAKSRCVEFYGTEPRYAYIYGMSGGGVRSSGMLERFPKVYDGAVPVVGIGSLDTIWELHSLYEDYRTRPDGREAVVQAGLPKVLAYALNRLPPLGVGFLMLDVVRYKVDPAYFDDFWKLPGYADDRTRGTAERIEAVAKAVDARGHTLVTDRSFPDDSLAGFTLTFNTGAAQGPWRRVTGNQGGTISIQGDGPSFETAKPGDSFVLDNRDLLAWRAYHRLKDKRSPAERMGLLEPDRPLGKFRGKMIAVFGTHDPLMWPVVAVRYSKAVAEPQSFRLHFVEYAGHGRPSNPGRAVSWETTERKAMDDLMRWVEEGVAPPPGTVYRLSSDNQIVLPEAAAERKGYQPVVSMKGTAKGGEATFDVVAEDPDNDVVRVEIDYDGKGQFDESRAVRGPRVAASFRHVYGSPGNHVATVRVTDSTVSKGSESKGIQNLAHASVVTGP